ncbi:MAG: hypothetical protein M3Q83_02425, partial [Pseudomonadota bacterium]|nr:hypothetical protein [Pseudomonadota bacterium]
MAARAAPNHFVTFFAHFALMSLGKKERFAALGLKPPVGAEEFAESLKQRQQAAQGLEKDLLAEVPLLYGSPGSIEPHGDPGVVIAQAHRTDMLRRNGGGALNASLIPDEVTLPFERTIEVLV